MAATLIGLTGMTARAQTDAEVEALLVEALLLPDWETILSGSAGVGYKDNVFLSHAEPEGAAFVAASAELLVLRLTPVGTRFNFFGNAEPRNFFGNGISHQELTSFSQALVERDFTDTFSGSLAAQYYFQDQILDVSVTETNREAVPVIGHTVSLKPNVRANLPARNWIELEGSGTRQCFTETLDDYWEGGGKLTFGRGDPHRSHVKLSYEPLWRMYDSDPARTASGEAITNSLRTSFQQDVRVTWRQHWDQAQHWRTALSGGIRLNDENGGGYADYTRWYGAARIQYRARGWEISAEGRFARYDYHNQTVSATDTAKRNRTEWRAVLNVERELAETVAWVTSYEYETTLSNDPLETYSVNTVSTSLRWEF